jgi:hypothetical protein
LSSENPNFRNFAKIKFFGWVYDFLKNEGINLVTHCLVANYLTKHHHYNQGTEGVNTATINNNIGLFHYVVAESQLQHHSADDGTRRSHLLQSKSYFQEAIRIYSKIYEPNNPLIVNGTNVLSIVLQRLKDLHTVKA